MNQDGNGQGNGDQQAPYAQAERYQVLLALVLAVPADVTDDQQGQPDHHAEDLQLVPNRQRAQDVDHQEHQGRLDNGHHQIPAAPGRMPHDPSGQQAQQGQPEEQKDRRPVEALGVGGLAGQAAQARQRGGHEGERHDRVGASGRRARPCRCIPTAQAISLQQDETGEGKDQRIVLGTDAVEQEQLPGGAQAEAAQK